MPGLFSNVLSGDDSSNSSEGQADADAHANPEVDVATSQSVEFEDFAGNQHSVGNDLSISAQADADAALEAGWNQSDGMDDSFG